YAPNAKNRVIINSYGMTTGETSVVLEAKEGGNNTLTLETTTTNQADGYHYGIVAENNARVLLSAETGINSIKIGDANQFVNSTGNVAEVLGIFNLSGANTKLTSKENNISIYAPNAKSQRLIFGTGKLDKGKESILLQATSGDNHLTLSSDLLNERVYQLIQGDDNNKIRLEATGDNLLEYNGELTAAMPTEQTALDNNQSFIRGIISWKNSEVNLDGQNNIIRLQGKGDGLGVGYQKLENGNWYTYQTMGLLATNVDADSLKSLEGISKIALTAKGNNVVDINLRSHGETYGVVAQNQGEMTLSADGANWIRVINPERDTPLMNLNAGMKVYRMGLYSSIDSAMRLQAASNYIEIGGNPVMQVGIAVNANASAEVIAKQGNNVVRVDNAVVGSRGVSVQRTYLSSKATTPNSKLNLIASKGNNIIEMQGDSADIAVVENSEVLKKTGDYLSQFGSAAVEVREEGSTATLTARNNLLLHTIPTETGAFRHYGAYVEDKGKATLIAQEINQVSGADTGAYAALEGKIDFTGRNNLLSAKKFGVIAKDKGQVSLLGEITNQVTDAEVGLSAGGEGVVKMQASHNLLKASQIAAKSVTQGQITVDGEYSIEAPVAAMALSGGQIDFNYHKASHITGDMLASDKGQIAVKSAGSTLWMKGDGEAVNGGVIQLDLTPRSTLVGRLDNFNAYGTAAHQTLFPFVRYTPAETQAQSAGRIHLFLDNDALWKMTGQSWVSEVGGTGTVDINSQDEGRALHIDKLAGANRFLMRLNKDGVHSDMLYIKEGTAAAQDVVIKNEREVLDSMDYGERLRFAAVQSSQNEFVDGKVYSDGGGLMEQALKVEYSAQESDPDNREAYNLAFNGGEAMSKEKPGDSYAKATYGGEGSQNVYLVKYKTNTPSRNSQDIGRIEDAAARYGFILDTYTKREGERAYSLNDIKEGAWIRGTHTRLEQDDRFRLNSNDYEIGYDKFRKNEAEKKQKWGLSFTYGYAKHNIEDMLFKGRIEKYLLSLYHTNQRNNEEGDNSYYN
ncbi:hypothetical protein, partial [Gallibacterium salpingitidis]